MGVFKKMREMTGSVPRELLQNGLLGRAIITDVQRTGVSTGPDFSPSHVCVFTVEVALDDTPRYMATCRQAVDAMVLPQLMSGGAMVAVRVNPQDHSNIALSLGEQAPTVRSASSGDANTGSAADILANGTRCKAVIVEYRPLGMKSSRSGDDMYAFILTIIADGRPPYQVPVGNPVPAEALPLLYPGSTVPAMRMEYGADHEVVIDWKAALGQPTGF